jgi:hypothetical protein
MQEGSDLNVCHSKSIFIVLQEDRTLEVQEDRHNSFRLGTGHHSILEPAEEEEEEEEEEGVEE